MNIRQLHKLQPWSLTIVGSYSNAIAPCAFEKSCFLVGSRNNTSVGSPSLRVSHHNTCKIKQLFTSPVNLRYQNAQSFWQNLAKLSLLSSLTSIWSLFVKAQNVGELSLQKLQSDLDSTRFFTKRISI